MAAGKPVGWEYFLEDLSVKEEPFPSVLPKRILREMGPKAFAVRKADIEEKGQAIGRLAIPSIGLEVMFLEGADNQMLRRGVGHIPGTVLPGAFGNSGIAGHRDTFFRRRRNAPGRSRLDRYS